MLLRPAKYSDIPRLADLAREAHARSVYADDPMSAKRFKDDCAAAIMAPSMCLFVVEVEGRVEGFLFGITEAIYAFSLNRYATDLLTYVSDAGRGAWPKLWDAFEEWVECLPETMRVVEINPAATDAISDSERTGKMLERRGYDRFGGLYRKRIRS